MTQVFSKLFLMQLERIRILNVVNFIENYQHNFAKLTYQTNYD